MRPVYRPGRMGRMTTRPKRPRDPNQLAKLIVDLSIGETHDVVIQANKNSAAVERGRLGGLAGGKARAAALTDRRRSQIAKKAAKARWKKHPHG